MVEPTGGEATSVEALRWRIEHGNLYPGGPTPHAGQAGHGVPVARAHVHGRRASGAGGSRRAGKEEAPSPPDAEPYLQSIPGLHNDADIYNVPRSITLPGEEAETDKSVKDILTLSQFRVNGDLVPSPYHNTTLEPGEDGKTQTLYLAGYDQAAMAAAYPYVMANVHRWLEPQEPEASAGSEPGSDDEAEDSDDSTPKEATPEQRNARLEEILSDPVKAIGLRASEWAQ